MNVVIFVGVVGVFAVFIVEVNIGVSNPVFAIPAVPSTPWDGGNNDDDSASEEGAE